MWQIFKDGAISTGHTNTGVGDPIGIMLRVINLLLYIVGFAAVVVVIIGGIMYATSAGDEKRTTAAKKTIIGSLIGLGIAVLAYVLVNFVLDVL